MSLQIWGLYRIETRSCCLTEFYLGVEMTSRERTLRGKGGDVFEPGHAEQRSGGSLWWQGGWRDQASLSPPYMVFCGCCLMTPWVTYLTVEELLGQYVLHGPVAKLNDSIGMKSFKQSLAFYKHCYCLLLLLSQSGCLLTSWVYSKLELLWGPRSLPSPCHFIFCWDCKWITEAHF